ncbi:hypothetical protein [Pseudomonas taiwanensis]|uniref:hypothetical protein n=1 Tax=Pseudomonas taiwanensis TaxID=470150 RepID=UPI001646F97A|nr:hypothetical protein [Pseudomonas taiwanensis]MBC3489507.1 hypothetical protein [Pseudomonas taiwanensis]
MNTYTFRAECLDDVFAFLGALALKHRIEFCTLQPDQCFPDVEVSLRTDGTIKQLQALIYSIDDAHIIAESLERVE